MYLLLLAEGFEEVEALTQVDYLRRAGIELVTVSIYEKLEVVGAHGVTVLADRCLSEISSEEVTGVILPGGLPGATNLQADGRVIELVRKLYDQKKLVAAICAAPIVLDRAGILKHHAATAYPGYERKLDCLEFSEEIVVRDGHVITARGPFISPYFAFALVEYIKGKEAVETLKRSILFHLVS